MPKAEKLAGTTPKLAYAVDEAAAATSIGKTNLYVAIAAGTLPARKFGRKTLILAEDLIAYLNALPAFEVMKPDC